MGRHILMMVIYESAASVKPKPEPLAAPMAPPWTVFRYTTTEPAGGHGNAGERPERRAGGGDGLGIQPKSRAFSLNESLKHLCTKAVNSGVWGGTPGYRSCRCYIFMQRMCLVPSLTG